MARREWSWEFPWRAVCLGDRMMCMVGSWGVAACAVQAGKFCRLGCCNRPSVMIVMCSSPVVAARVMTSSAVSVEFIREKSNWDCDFPGATFLLVIRSGAGLVRLLPPYRPENLQCFNSLVLDRLRRLVSLMAEDISKPVNWLCPAKVKDKKNADITGFHVTFYFWQLSTSEEPSVMIIAVPFLLTSHMSQVLDESIVGHFKCGKSDIDCLLCHVTTRAWLRKKLK